MGRFARLPAIPILGIIVSTGGTAYPLPAAAQSSTQTASPNVHEVLAEGVAAMHRGDAPTARRLFRHVLAVDPKNVTARTYLGVLADGAGDLADAERQFAVAAAVAPSSPEARNNYGAALLKEGKTDQAAKEFEASLRLNPEQAGALSNLAQIRFESGDLRTAQSLFEKAAALVSDVQVAHALVVISLRLHEPAEAARKYSEYSALLGRVSQNIVTPAGRTELGAALLEQGLAKEASQELLAAVEVEPASANEVVLLARAYRGQKEFSQAEQTIKSALARGLETAPLFAELAETEDAAGHVEDAIPAMRRAIQLEPTSEAYRFRYAMLLTDANAPQAAVIRLKEALDEFPKSSKLWFAMGLAQSKDNKKEAAIEAFEQCIALDPQISSAYAYMGIIEVDLGKIQEAVAFYRKALASDEHSAVTHYLISRALERLTPPDDAGTERHLRRALELDSGFQQAHVALGKLFLRTNHFEGAARELEGVIRADPKLGEAYYQLGRVYMRLKRKEEAQAMMAKFEQLSDAEKEQSESERREIVRRLVNVRF